MTRRGSRWAALPLAFLLIAISAGAASADAIKTNVVKDGNDTILLPATGSGSTSVSYWVENTGSTRCDASDSHPATVTITTPTAVTAAPARFDLVGCGMTKGKAVTLSSSTPGSYGIGISVSGGLPNSSWDTSQATWTLIVRRSNTPPTVTISGVTDGTSYEKGSVPIATCNVADAEDGAKTFAATLSAVTGSLSSYGLGSQTASCSYTDAGGLNGSASATYSIVDSKAPVLTIPGDITQEATGPAGATVSYTATAEDVVDPSPAVGCSPPSGTTFALGSTLVECSATDAAGNMAVGQFKVIVQDGTRPELTLPGTQTIEATGPTGAVVTYEATASDAVDGAITPSCKPGSGSTFSLGTTPVNCSATDQAGNEATGGFDVKVQDSTKPELTLPKNVTVEATGPNGSTVEFVTSAEDIVDGTREVVCDSPSGTTFSLGTTTVTCSATDTSNNSQTGSFTVTVQDTTKPTLKLPDDITLEATKTSGADATFSASASDLVDGDVPVLCTPTSGTTFDIKITTVTCSATDAAKNTAIGTFTVTVIDTTPPAFSNVPADQTVEATGPNGAIATYTAPTAADVVDGSTAVLCAPASGGTFDLGPNVVKCETADARGNMAIAKFTIEVVDTTPPEVEVPDNIVAEATSSRGAAVSWEGVSASDIVDGAMTPDCSAASGDLFPFGVATVTCSATDAAGNVGGNAFTITVQDKTAPVVTVPDNQTVEATGPGGAVATWSGVSASDTVDGTVEATCDYQSGDTFELTITTVTCRSVDKAGNEGFGAFTITVEDTTAPEVTVPVDFTVEASGPNGATASYTASAEDIVDGPLAANCSPASTSRFALGPNIVTCTATDSTGNVSEAQSFTITVVDTTAPAIAVPADITVEATSSRGQVVNYSASASDLVDGSVPVTCLPASGTTFGLGTTKVTCNASDNTGNEASKSFDVTVTDTTKPELNLPADFTRFATSASGASIAYSATASDTVDGAIVPSCSPASGTTFAPGKTTVTCTATDAAGNARTGTFIVSVKFDFRGFLAPVDGNKVLNGMKAGSTAPIKWQVPDQSGGYISLLSIVSKTASGVVSCTGGTLDDLDQYSTGSSSLRYDSSANQYIYNWQSPKNAGKCYDVSIGLTDGETYTARFSLK